MSTMLQHNSQSTILDESYNKKPVSSEITGSDMIGLTWVFETNKGLEKFK